MFCSKCGRPVNENALFCTFCGNPLRTTNDGGAPEIPTATSSASIGDSVPVYGGSMPSSVPMPERSPDFSDNTPVYKEASSLPLNDNNMDYREITGKSIPISETQTASDTVLTNTEAASGQAEINSPVSVPIVDIESVPQKVEKYYSFGHIALCLAAVAVMAIVAGVFAGLYFSVV